MRRSLLADNGTYFFFPSSLQQIARFRPASSVLDVQARLSKFLLMPSMERHSQTVPHHCFLSSSGKRPPGWRTDQTSHSAFIDERSRKSSSNPTLKTRLARLFNFQAVWILRGSSSFRTSVLPR